MEFELKDIKRFMNKIHKTDNCWIWSASLFHDGYGKFNLNKKIIRAHRMAYEIFNDEINTDLVLDHLCRNRKCVNPQHLEPVTPKENILRGNGFSAINHRKTKCPYGHFYNAKNKRGDRVCLLCKKEIDRRYREKCKILGKNRNRYLLKQK